MISAPNMPSATQPLQSRAATGRITWAGPLGMVLARSVFALRRPRPRCVGETIAARLSTPGQGVYP